MLVLFSSESFSVPSLDYKLKDEDKQIYNFIYMKFKILKAMK
jgi:hypothetical protein